MGKPLVGEVVVLPFPQSDLQVGKRRPALVVADLPGDDLILCQITSQTRNDGGSVPLPVADFERGRLAVDCFIRPQRLFTVEQSVILYAAGKIKAAKLIEVKARLRQLFACPAAPRI
jgi:mRNA interferase MazF